MNRRSDEAGFLTFQDVLQCWKETERHYGCTLELNTPMVGRKGDRFHLSLVMAVYQINGQKARKCVQRFTVDFPSIHARTYPGIIQHLLNRVSAWFEGERKREAAAIAQLPLFPEG